MTGDEKYPWPLHKSAAVTQAAIEKVVWDVLVRAQELRERPTWTPYGRLVREAASRAKADLDKAIRLAAPGYDANGSPVP